eukprot:4861961-Heterocapsa_arctica.AAC.2
MPRRSARGLILKGLAEGYVDLVLTPMRKVLDAAIRDETGWIPEAHGHLHAELALECAARKVLDAVLRVAAGRFPETHERLQAALETRARAAGRRCRGPSRPRQSR